MAPKLVGTMAAGLALTACAQVRIPVSSELVWTRADETEVLVMPGDVVRIEASGPVKVTSVLRGPTGEADVKVRPELGDIRVSSGVSATFIERS